MEEKALYARNMRGALTGKPEPEKTPMRYCKGKLDNGFPCRIVMIGDDEHCTRHRKEIEALEAGAPLPVNRIEREVEDTKLAKFRCGKKNCTRAVKEEGEMCWQHKGLEDQVEAGAVSGAEQLAQKYDGVEYKSAPEGLPPIVESAGNDGDMSEVEGVQATVVGSAPPPPIADPSASAAASRPFPLSNLNHGGLYRGRICGDRGGAGHLRGLKRTHPATHRGQAGPDRTGRRSLRKESSPCS